MPQDNTTHEAGNQRPNAEQTSQTKKAKVARTEGPPSYTDMLAEDERNAKRIRKDDDEWFTEPTICLGVPRIKTIKLSSLGPILKKRFVCAM